MSGAKVVLVVGIIFQSSGSLLIAIPLIRKVAYFDTSLGTLNDERGRWPVLMKIGFWVYVLGYLPLLVGRLLS
jgi:hypothetical protein